MAASDKAKTPAYHEGYNAYYFGAMQEENPFSGQKYEDWLEGWYDAYDLDMSHQEFDMYWYDTGE